MHFKLCDLVKIVYTIEKNGLKECFYFLLLIIFIS